MPIKQSLNESSTFPFILNFRHYLRKNIPFLDDTYSHQHELYIGVRLSAHLSPSRFCHDRI